MGSLLVLLVLLALGTAVVVGVATWVSSKAATLRNVVAFCLASGSAYSIGFVLNMWTLAAAGAIPASNINWPSFTWLAITLACLVAAFQTAGSPFALAIPFCLNAVLALVFAPSVRERIFIAGPLFVAGIVIFFYKRCRGPRNRTPTPTSFGIGEYRLDDAAGRFTDLVEFSPAEYAAMGRQFEGEKNYTAPPTSFLGCSWNVNLQSVNGQICKISPYLLLPDKEQANPIAMHVLHYCREQLGQPAEQKTGLFVWDTADGNVILQTGETAEGLVVSLFLTSHSIRSLARLQSA